MLGINSNINSLVAQQNLTSSGSALSQAITRLSSGKRINSAADDAAGLAISNIMQTQINGLNQGVSNANNGVSMVQTASSGLASLTSSLQTIRQLATQASDGSMTDTDRQALQQEVAQQIQEVNRIASQTTYNGMNVLNGSLGNVSFQVGANVGQTISLNLSQNMSAAQLGGGNAQAGNTLGSFSVNLTSGGAYNGTKGTPGNSTPTGTETVTQAAVTATYDGTNTTYTMGGTALTDTDQIALANAAYAAQNGGTTLDQAAQADPGTAITGTATTVTATSTDGTTATYSLNGTTTTDAATISAADTVYDDTSGSSNSMATDAETAQKTATPVAAAAPIPSTTTAAITQINVVADGNGGFTLTDQNNTALSTTAANALFTKADGFTVGTDSNGNTTLSFSAANVTDTTFTATDAGTAISDALDAAAGVAPGSTNASATDAVGAQITALNAPPAVSNIDISTQTGASNAMEAIDNALNTVDNLQATLGAAQNRFTAITTTQQAQSTDLSSAQSSIQDADFAQETANLSKAQVLQQAGISVLAQANSQPQQILKLLQ